MKYFLIACSFRRLGSDQTDFYNDAHKGSLVTWLKQVNREEGDWALLSAIPITKAEHRWLTENL